MGAAIFPEMVNQTVSKTVVDFFAGKSEAEIEKFIALGFMMHRMEKYKWEATMFGNLPAILY